MKFSMDSGDSNFIGVVNTEKYKSCLHEDWELDILLRLESEVF